MEFQEALRLAPENPRQMNNRQLDLVEQAHHSLAVTYSKKEWFELALREAELTFNLRPTPKNYDLLELIKRRQQLEQLEMDLSPATLP